MDNNIKKKISLKEYLVVLLFFISLGGSIIFNIGIKAMIFKSLWNIFIVRYASQFISAIIKNGRSGRNFVRVIALIIVIVFVCKFGIKFIGNIVDLTFNNKNEVITDEYYLYKSRSTRRDGYHCYLVINGVELEIDSSLYNELKNNDYRLGLDYYTIKVEYWKFSKVIDTLEIIE